jgi:tRNA(Ile)-lysidine synthase
VDLKVRSAKNPSPEQRVLAFIKENNIVAHREKLVVAVSGGADSVCLLYVLAALRKELVIELHIAHLNHQLRGKDSDADARYVTSLAKKLGIPATIASQDVKAYQKQHRLSLEEAAREVRYSFFAEVAAKIGATKVAVGHTADDHIETMLMHLVRGSGMRGLRGLKPVSQLKFASGSPTVIRPLLELSRAETTSYCRAHKIKPRLDASNLTTKPMRNKVRLQLLPLLRKYNPQIGAALKRLAYTAAGDYDYIEKVGLCLADSVYKKQKGAVAIKKKELLALHPALQRQILRSAVAEILGSLKDIESSHIEDIIEALAKPAGKVIGLPFGLTFTIEYDRYVLAMESASLCPYSPIEGEITLNIPGKTSIPGGVINATIEKKSAGKEWGGESNDFSACLDYDRAGKKLIVRSRRPGDRFQPLGMAQPKKLNVFMIDTRIPQVWRGNIPLVGAGNHIAWVAGYRIDERYKVRPETKSVLHLEFKSRLKT